MWTELIKLKICNGEPQNPSRYAVAVVMDSTIVGYLLVLAEEPATGDHYIIGFMVILISLATYLLQQNLEISCCMCSKGLK